MSTVCLELATNPEIAKQIRIYGAIVPADFVAAFKARFGEPTEHRRREREQEDLKRLISPRQDRTISESTKALIEEAFEQMGGRPPSEEDRREADKRLKEGSDVPLRGTSEWKAYWEEYYSRPYVQEAQAAARKMLGVKE